MLSLWASELPFNTNGKEHFSLRNDSGNKGRNPKVKYFPANVIPAAQLMLVFERN